MIWRHALLAPLTWATVASTVHRAKGKCSPSCTQFRMQEGMQLSGDGTTLGAKQGAAPCHVEVFGRARLHAALAHKWLYFVGDSSTRGLMLALYYELLGATQTLAALKLDLGVGDALKGTPKEEFRLARLRSEALFHYGNASSIAECKGTLVGLARADKWTLESCEDFGDPCNDAQPSGAGAEGLGFAVADTVTLLAAQLPVNVSFLAGKSGEVAKLRLDRGEALVQFPDLYNPVTGSMERLISKPGHRSDLSKSGFLRVFSLPLAALKRVRKDKHIFWT
jgi:hypothetical protein